MLNATVHPIRDAAERIPAGRGHVRPIEAGDLAQIVDLYLRVYPQRPAASVPELRARLEWLLLGHPWRDERLPSLVFEEADGTLNGCLGVMPRPMRLNDRRVCAAVSHSFLVAPESRATMAAVHLARRFLSGPQDISLAEGNDGSRRIWESLNGSTAPLYSLSWARPLRPGRYALSVLGRRNSAGARAWVLRSFATVVDRIVPCVCPGHFRFPEPAVRSERLNCEVVADGLSSLVGRRLQPRYASTEFERLIEFLRHNPTSANWRQLAVRDRRGALLGWYIYSLRRDGQADVLQLAAAEESAGVVLDHLLHNAACDGATAVHGSLNPIHFATLASRHCLFHNDGQSWLLVHSTQSEFVRAFHEGKAYLSRLDGEWWISAMLGYN